MTNLEPYLPHMRMKPYDHQLVGIQALVDRPIFALFDEPGAGKTKQVIDPAQVLFFENVIDTVIVLCPASVRTVWTDPELGELRKHLWEHTPTTVTEYHQKLTRWRHGPDAGQRLNFVITNFDFIRKPGRSGSRRWVPGEKLQRLLGIANRRTWLVIDESSAVKSYKALQTKACRALREKCGRVTLLNGTPIENSPGDLFSQAFMMDPNILNCPTWLHFRSRYAIVTAHERGFEQIVSWHNLDDLRERLQPFVLRRLKKDCLDLPPKLPVVALTVPLDRKTWQLYKQMRDELVAWLTEQSVSISAQAGVKIMRLAQLCSGFIGGVVDLDNDETELPAAVAQDGRPDWLPFARYSDAKSSQIATSELRAIEGIAQVGREKIDHLLSWLEARLEIEPNVKVIVWCRFRVELYRLKAELEKQGKFHVAAIHGAQKKEDRTVALRLLHPESSPKDEPVVVLGTLGTGARGLNLTASHTVIYLSNDFRYGTYVQSEERVHRPGQVSPVEYYDVVATGPDGQRTVDHILLDARQRKENLATWTTSAWVTELVKESATEEAAEALNALHADALDSPVF
jgi:SNF2 family DNA or RNA helicase